MGSFSLGDNHEFPPFSTPLPRARTEWDYGTTDNSYHTPAWHQSASRNQDCMSDLSVLVPVFCFTLTLYHLHTSPTVHLLCDLGWYSATPARLLSIHCLL